VRVRTSGAEARTYFSWLYDTSEEVAERLTADTEIRPQGLKPTLVLGLYAALKRRSSTVPHIFTVLHIFVSFSATFEFVLFPRPAFPKPT